MCQYCESVNRSSTHQQQLQNDDDNDVLLSLSKSAKNGRPVVNSVVVVLSNGGLLDGSYAAKQHLIVGCSSNEQLN
ncbi:hypothetical protein TKK_0000928 [Trichogramma kaykai]